MVKGRGLAAYLLMGLLAGCAAGGPLPIGAASTVPERAAQDGPAPPGDPGTDLKLLDADNAPVFAAEWLPDDPKAVILALHGYGDYGRSSFRAAATYWATQGIATIAPDQRGFGRNASRGRWPGAAAMITDAGAYAAQIRARFPCLPLTVLGHSMGGGIVLGAAPRLEADALILAAPAIWGGAALNPFHRALAWTAAAVVPDRRFTGRGVVRIQASDNIEAMRALGRDPLYLSPPSAREIMGLVRITDRAAEAAPLVKLPTLMLLGEKDQIVPNKTVKRVFAQLPGPQKTIQYPEGWHLLFRDLQAQRVWDDTARFVLDAPSACAKP